jgi:multidrug efflux system membrane fusion protein
MAFSNAVADEGKAVAERDAARAAVKSAQIDLDHATVRAPIAGRIGYALVSEGGLVSQTEATPLALIQSIDSVYVDLVQPASAPRMSSFGSQASETSAANPVPKPKPKSKVSIDITEDAGTAIHGELQFEDISVDPGTGQVRLRGLLRNPEHRLLPGMYVRATVEMGTDEQALFIPQKALRFTADGAATVQEVDAQHVLRVRRVVLGDMQGARWQVLCGLTPGATVVANFADDVEEGTKVIPQLPPSHPTSHPTSRAISTPSAA